VTTLVACAVVRDDPPRVFIAQDLATNWVLACQLVAKTPGIDLPIGERDALRSALVEERWGDAVFAYIARTGVAVDVYESTEMFVPSDVEVGPMELQLSPLYTG